MSHFVGLDVSQKMTAICVVDKDGRRIWRGQCPSVPEQISVALRRYAGDNARIGIETGAMTPWIVHELRNLGFEVICLDARHARAALKMQINKNDQNDAEGLAQIVRTGWYRSVHVKSFDSHRARAILGARTQLVGMTTRLSNHIRGVLKTFGLLSALAYVSTVEDPSRFARSRSVGAHLGLTPRQYQSGEVDRSGRISRCGDTLTRTLLYEAAGVILTRVKKASGLRDWAAAIAKRSGPGKARVALARKLSVILHSIWRSGEPFRWSEPKHVVVA
jgi:transposase